MASIEQSGMARLRLFAGHQLEPVGVLTEENAFVTDPCAATDGSEAQLSGILVRAVDLLHGAAAEVAFRQRTPVEAALRCVELGKIVGRRHSTRVEEILVVAD